MSNNEDEAARREVEEAVQVVKEEERMRQALSKLTPKQWPWETV